MKKEKTIELKRAIVISLSEKLDKEVEKVVARKMITPKDYESLKHKHQRSSKNKNH
jgi:hypothetical protein